ncbi:MAG: sigma-54 dependent transcriptional regulator [Syntrophaceae bacterium]
MATLPEPVRFSDPQWRFLSVLYVLGAPVHVDVAAVLAPLKPGELLDALRRGQSAGLLRQDHPDMLTFENATDPTIEAILRKKDTQPFRRALLASIEEHDLAQRIPDQALIKLLAEAGRTHEAAYLAGEQARLALSEGHLADALSRTQTAVSLLANRHESPEDARLYVLAATSLAELRFRAGMGLDDVGPHLDKARALAKKLGDRRSLALIGLHQGRLYFLNARLEDTLSALQVSLSEVERLGDADILEQTAEFHGLYAYLQGRYREAVEHFDRAMNVPNENYSPFVPLYLGFSAASVGQFHRAVGLLDTYSHRCLQRGHQALSSHARAVLAYVLTLMGRGREALEKLIDNQDMSSMGYWITEMIRIYQTFTAGGISESHARMTEAVGRWGGTAPAIRQYPSPWMLEMLDEYDRLTLAPIPGFEFHNEIERIISGPNIHLKGVALRLKARRLSSGRKKRACLQESEISLVESGDPLEVSKTRLELARLHLTMGEQTQALAQTLKAREGLTGLGERFFPDDLRYLLPETDQRTPSSPSSGQAFTGMLDMLTELIPSPDVHDLLGQVVLAASSYVRAERSGLFWFEQKGPLLKGGRNLPTDEVFGDAFRANLTLVFTAHTRGEPLCRTLTGDDRITRRVLCLPVEDGVLYFDNSYDVHAFDFLDPAMLGGLRRILGTTIKKVLEYHRIRQERDLLVSQRSLIDVRPDRGEFLTGNARMQEILSELDRAATTDATILITGETGVGKELLAKRVHAVSPRRRMPLITVDLTSIPETLVESELFGHEKGAFTGADSQKRGRIELAHQGTLFIDELGEIPASVQVKLLRTLQERSFMRLGGSRVINSEFRLVAATNRDLTQEVKAGRFRHDLYYRVNVMPVHVPPLRERVEDVLLLARHFLGLFAAKYRRPDAALTEEDKARLASYPWPGNVRELRNVIERGVLLGSGPQINLSLPLDAQPSAAHPFADSPTLDEVQRRYIAWVLERTKGRIGGFGGAAETLGMKRTSLNARMKKLGLR